MNKRKIGRFTIETGSPYPVSIYLNHGSSHETFCFNHKELLDLEYAIQWAIRESKERLMSIPTAKHDLEKQ